MPNKIVYRLEWKDNVNSKNYGIGYFNFKSKYYPNIDLNIFEDFKILKHNYSYSNFYDKLLIPEIDFDESKELTPFIFGFTSFTTLKQCLGIRYFKQFLKIGFVVKKYTNFSYYEISKSGMQCIFIPTEEGTIIENPLSINPIYRIEHINKTEYLISEINSYVTKGVYRMDSETRRKNTRLGKMFKKHQHFSFPSGKEDFNNYIKMINGEYFIKSINIPFNNFFYGFESLEKTKKWFTKKELEVLKSVDFIVKEFLHYENNIISESKKQVIFIPKDKGNEVFTY